MKRSNKKGFTIVELIVVIAVIAVLTAVLIPTIGGIIQKSNESADLQTVTAINKILTAEEILSGKPDNPTEMLKVIAENGYNVDKLNMKSKNYKILWNQGDNQLVLLNKEDDSLVVGNLNTESYLNWEFVNSQAEIGNYSVYLNDGYSDFSAVVTAGVDVGTNTNVNVTYETDSNQTVVIRTNGGTLTVNNANADVSHYGVADEVIIEAVADASFHLFAEVTTVKIQKGNFVPEASAKVQVLVITGSSSDKVSVEVKSGAEINNLVIDSAKATFAESIKTALQSYVASEAIKENVSADKIDDAITAATAFGGGLGTKNSPYIIETPAHLSEISNYYAEGYKYYKVKDGVTEINCNGISLINLNGSFNGNGVKLTNIVGTVLFKNIGYQNNNDTITVENFKAEISGAPGLAYQIVNSGTTTFKNIKITGYLEGGSNLGCFYRFGTCQWDDGANYTVKFVNCQASADIYGSSVGGFVGHAYPGTGFMAAIDVDDDCTYTGTVYSEKANQGNEFVGIGTYTLTKNGEAYTQEKARRETPTPITISQDTDGAYWVNKVKGAEKVVVNILPQLTAYDDNGVNISNLSGITGLYKFGELAASEDSIKVLDKVDSAVIENGANTNGYSATLNDGVLTIHTNSSANYLDGTVTLKIVQYDSNGQILAIGSVKLVTITK